MKSPSDHIRPESRFLSTFEKEALLKQHGIVIWLFGLSGSGKSSIAAALEKSLNRSGRVSVVLDGDHVRSGLNSDLGFSESDRKENIRRVAEVAKILASQGIVTIVAAITPKGELRELARGVLGARFFPVFVQASYAVCEARDVKGLYAKASRGEILQFTGKDASFEPPQTPLLILDTERESEEESLLKLLDAVLPLISKE